MPRAGRWTHPAEGMPELVKAGPILRHEVKCLANQLVRQLPMDENYFAPAAV